MGTAYKSIQMATQAVLPYLNLHVGTYSRSKGRSLCNNLVRTIVGTIIVQLYNGWSLYYIVDTTCSTCTGAQASNGTYFQVVHCTLTKYHT